jgi:hypothetical protein
VISKTFKLLALLILSKVEAHPVAYAKSQSIMTWNSKEMSDWMYTYTFTPKYSLSARYQRIDTKDGERSFYFPHANFLVKRWNELESQANIYLSAGYGAERIKKTYKQNTFLALETDWESREFYTSFREEVLITKNQNIYMTRVRAGFAPYLAQFNELNSWFILQLENQSRATEEYTITPMVRFFYKNVLTEFGYSQHGDTQFNFMLHF